MRLRPADLGDSGDDVAWVQRVLVVYPITGVMDEKTVAKVRGFQYAKSMPVTGVLDAVTYALINAR